MIQNLYREDPGLELIAPEKIQLTFDSLTTHLDRGVIMVIEKDDEIIGYAILINFWSNEFGGNVLDIDELYIKKEFRSQGIGTAFIKYLTDTKFGNSVALQLEVTPKNSRAQSLYEKLGFELDENMAYTLML